MRKGFTLVEVLAVVVVIGIIFLVTFPTVLNFIKKSQDNIDSNTMELIENSAKEYENDHVDDIEDISNYCISISRLISEGYIEEDIVSSKDNKLLHQSLNKENSEYEILDSCPETND